MTAPTPARRKRRPNLWGVFPLVWLLYLYFPIAAFVEHPRSTAEWFLGAVFLGSFVAVILRAFGTFGAPHDVRWNVAAWAWSLALYGLAFPTVGFTGVSFAIYAASAVGFQASAVLASTGTVVVVTVMLLPAWLGAGRVAPLEAVPFMIFAVIAAAANHASFRRMVLDRKLRQVQAEKERLAQTAERERIARDLHDLLGHTLSVIVLKSELAARLAERDPARAADEIREVERISRDALAEVRAAVRGYRGSGLGAELGRAKVALDAAGVALDYEADAALDLPRPVEAAMELVLREAVTNVVRHARARRLTVRVSRRGDAHELEVADDGVGGDGPEGSGLTGMRERVRAVGGTLARDGRNGTRLLARFPAAPPGADPAAPRAAREAT